MDKKSFVLGMLAASAVLLAVANWFYPSAAQAQFAIKDRDYQVAAAHNQQGGESLYVIDSRTGQLAVMAFDPATRQIAVRAIAPVENAFGGNGGAIVR